MNAQTRLALTFIAGFCDTATFVHMDGVFSAHVTGNFVLFAAALAQGIAPGDYLKILTFPVFIAAVACATLLFCRGEDKGQGRLWVFRFNVLLLGGASLAAVLGAYLAASPQLGWLDTAITLIVVFAMASQNTLHHFIGGPMTTVMTGTVMNSTATATRRFLLKQPTPQQPAKPGSKPKSRWLMGSFVGGCIAGALLTKPFGLAALLVASLFMVAILMFDRRQPASSA